jgi:hypothetical protein
MPKTEDTKADTVAWETFGHVGGTESGEAFNKTMEANVTTRWAVDSTDSGLTYVGTAIPGSLTSASVWCISVVDNSGQELFADGKPFFNQEWDERENLDYS